MTDKEAIKYLQQLYPNGGHCWLDEQRIEAIGMAIKELQKEPVSDIDFEQELYKAFGQVKDFTLGMQIAKRFYEMGKQHQEPVSEGLKEASRNYADNEEYGDDVYFAIRAAFEAGAKWHKTKDESTTEDLGEYINELSKQFPEVSFAKLSRIAVRVAKWQKQKDSIVDEDFEKASKEWLAPQLDKSYANYGETKMMELTRFDGYAMLDAIEFGAQWKEQQFEKNRIAHCDAQTKEEAEHEQDFVMGIIEKEHRQPTFDDAIKYGMRLKEQQLMSKAIDAKLLEGHLIRQKGVTHPLHVGDKIKVIVIKEN